METRNPEKIAAYLEAAKTVTPLEGHDHVFVLVIKGYDHTLGDGEYLVYGDYHPEKGVYNTYLLHDRDGSVYCV